MSNIESGVRRALDGLPVSYVQTFSPARHEEGRAEEERSIVVVSRLLPGVGRPQPITEDEA